MSSRRGILLFRIITCALILTAAGYFLPRGQNGFKPRAIVVHESASRWGNSNAIRQWHLHRGWSDIGYHAVILNGRLSGRSRYNAALDGKIEPGCPETRQGCHCKADDMNRKALGVCLIGDPTYSGYLTAKQMNSLIYYCAVECTRYHIPVSEITQHSDHDPKKPVDASLDMPALRIQVQKQIDKIRRTYTNQH